MNPSSKKYRITARRLLDVCGLRILLLARQASLFGFRRFCWGRLGSHHQQPTDRDFDVVKHILCNNEDAPRWVAYYDRRCRALLVSKLQRWPLLERKLIDKIIYEWAAV